MHNPCFECYIRRGHTYDPKNQETCRSCEYANAVKSRGARIEELEEILKGVMRQVDKWLTADDFDKSEVERAEIMNKRIEDAVRKD